MAKTAYIGVIFLSMLISQEIIVQPYLQNATPNSISILWETDSASPSIVEWGLGQFLNESTSGTSFTNYGNSKIHTVELFDLTPNTRYYYRVVVGNYESYSDLHDFITPPDPSSEASFRIIAMSDMQRDGSNPNKFDEIIHDGVIDYLSDEYSDDIAEELAMVLIPGDLVVTGSSYYEWQNTFFEPSEDLFSHVPLYPVFGNHEANTDYFIKYFHLPDNGTPGYEEHWYYTDYSNLRVIGLDSNTGYGYFDYEAQLIWMETVLEDACYNDHIDFVFAQLHHPHKSELWIPGEHWYTGEVIERMESFSDECGKPSIHFFGHTHGYSRGQSIDHNHLWVNVATAGGAIDYWGEYPQADYDEFTVSQDEWGFVVVDLDAGEEPQFTLKRISRGNAYAYRDNEVRDEVAIRFNNTPPTQPVGLSPSGQVDPDFLVLSADDFLDADGDAPMAAQWMVYQDCDLSSEPLIKKFVNMENWYFNENTQESIELTQISVSGLSGNSAFCWQVRYRDTSLGWSAWSESLSFVTGETQYSENLLLNPGGESGTDYWMVTEGYMESLESYECNGIEPYSGDYYFAVGALCNSASYTEAQQMVDISEFTDCIDVDLATLYYGGYLSNWGGSDHPEITIAFMDENGNEIDRAETLGTFNAFWTLLSHEIQIPIGTRSIQMILMGSRYAGDDNDSYFDDLFLKVWQDADCINVIMLGDLNQDEILNILDIIIMVNIILELDGYDSLADMNEDGIVNILDVITLINTILDP